MNTKKKALTITAALLVAGGLLIVMLIASIGYFTGQGETFIEKPDEEQATMLKEIDTLYDISSIAMEGIRWTQAS